MSYCEAACLRGAPDSRCPRDGCLVLHARQGDAEARERLFSFIAPCVLQQARRLCGGNGAAQDIAQAALVLVLEHLNELRRPDCLGPWVRRIVINTCRMEERRRAARAQTEELPPDAVSPSFEGEMLLDARRLLSRVVQSAPSLPPLLAETFRLRVLEGLTTKQTAARLGVSPDVVRARLARARRHLRKRSAGAG
jgi:RNA polymerase sigma-70 factor (ECF subfamily)